ncbi:class II fructose-bisphosphate aldolase [Agromyces aerolatus]|uniref:class II fructose-bisphosphate aldolase n=1 Tax=Agromyces sp. LY-1074 TaxID=3074080 RepID=UPI00285B96E3|nr:MULTISPECIES: class II fructose-bisphosphate aldolase [unclassified Agromyces]MDR5700485.1 class II fructose-bisphosphate aldolase [Agromyces sp. LY-1074]MDR5707006.1 class II fructose-bisphosphate aldolase [Agromyces sp. LY-1358]
MTLTTTAELMSEAQRAGRGVMAFNVITLEQAEGVLAAAELAQSDVILQVSENAVEFHGGRSAPLIGAAAALIQPLAIRASVHLDHATSIDLCRRAADEGASSVMFDGSRLDFVENVRATRAAAEWAQSADVFLEAELGEIGGKGGAHAPNVRTDPEEARQFVAETNVNALAVAVGSVHAQRDRTAKLEQDLIARLRDVVSVPLVLHGSSGVPDEEIREAIANGIVKVNVGTALNSAYTQRLREHLSVNLDGSDPRPGLREARDAVSLITRQLLDVARH